MSVREARTHETRDFVLESGDVLPRVVQAYHLDGEVNEERDNLVVVFHALTGTADAAGTWWADVIGPGRALDTDRYAVLCPNLLGSCYGTRGPWYETGAAPPPITPRDQARLVAGLVRHLGASSVALATGGSLGGMVALEWAATFPEWTRAAVVLAAPAAHTAQAIAWNHVQRRAVELGGDDGLRIARMVGMMTYRTADEFEARFGRERDDEGRWQVGRYLDHHGDRLVERFDAASYLALMGAMDAHDVGRERGGVASALAPFAGRLVGVGIPGDLLYSDADVRRWTDAAGAEYREVRSIHGHDAFLIEREQVAAILADVLATTAPADAHAEARR